jgi:hypothetical protein
MIRLGNYQKRLIFDYGIVVEEKANFFLINESPELEMIKIRKW